MISTGFEILELHKHGLCASARATHPARYTESRAATAFLDQSFGIEARSDNVESDQASDTVDPYLPLIVSQMKSFFLSFCFSLP